VIDAQGAKARLAPFALLSGALPSRYVYYRAVAYDRGGGWFGRNFMCTKEKSFTIRGIQNCAKRGFHRERFLEVDTGGKSAWTIRLNDPR
jgi:uncharacterized membrane protein